MWPNQVLNPGPLAIESDVLRGMAPSEQVDGLTINQYLCMCI